ncbi:cytochrome P450 monooxygenase [Amylostereum chailletii]|nr:cytochrome P450 monooxygenase [Amylostereum chailletii]
MTPGAYFLHQTLKGLLLPACIATGATQVLAGLTGRVSFTFYWPIWIISFFFILWGSTVLSSMREYHEIRRLGACKIPEISGKWPGNIDIILRRLKHGKDGYPFDTMDAINRKYGKIFNMRILGEDRIVTICPSHVKTVLATGFENWEKGSRFSRQMGSVLGEGVFNVDGDLWKYHRSTTRPFMSRARVTDFNVFGLYADEAVDICRSFEGAALDFQDLALRFTLDTATEFLFGKCAHALRHASDHSKTTTTNAFGNAFRNVQHHLAQRSRAAPLWPLQEIFKDRTSRDMAVIRSFIDPIIAHALARRREALNKQEVSSEAEAPTLLDHLVTQFEDPKLIIDETLNLLVAGRDTTASLLTFAVYLLASHPDVLARLREEVLGKVDRLRRPDIDDLKELPFLRAVINETLRLYPPVPANVRSPVKATTLPPVEPNSPPYYIPEGAKVPFPIIVIHRSKDLWGPSADQFDPGRFLDERKKYLLAEPFMFLPFGAGPRTCLGQQFAYHEASFFLIRLLQTFSRIELDDEAQPAESMPPSHWKQQNGRARLERRWPKAELNMYIKGGLWLRLFEDTER